MTFIYVYKKKIFLFLFLSLIFSLLSAGDIRVYCIYIRNMINLCRYISLESSGNGAFIRKYSISLYLRFTLSLVPFKPPTRLVHFAASSIRHFLLFSFSHVFTFSLTLCIYTDHTDIHVHIYLTILYI